MKKEPIQASNTVVKRDGSIANIPYHQVDLRRFDPKAIYIAHQLGSEKQSDFVLIADWIKKNNHSDCNADTLVELFDREVGLEVEMAPHPCRSPTNQHQ